MKNCNKGKQPAKGGKRRRKKERSRRSLMIMPSTCTYTHMYHHQHRGNTLVPCVQLQLPECLDDVPAERKGRTGLHASRINNVSRISRTIANGAQFAGTDPIVRTRATGSFPPKAKDERRKMVEGQLSYEGPSGIPWRVEEYIGGGGRGGATQRRAEGTQKEPESV
ncbi:uncharacterized protein LOC143903118 [Temnothorax americanus]|uniref:uncharacterized protein LOC143903118 n=1 Tax=Temnothorax americanus TaxID=1964332 RepID=UPI00406991F9